MVIKKKLILKEISFYLDLLVFSVFIGLNIYMCFTGFTRGENEIDYGLIAIRYLFQIFRLGFYMYKTSRTIKRRKTVTTLQLENIDTEKEMESNKNDDQNLPSEPQLTQTSNRQLNTSPD